MDLYEATVFRDVTSAFKWQDWLSFISEDQGEIEEKVLKKFPHRGDLGIPEIKKCLPKSAMQITIICFIKIPLFYECVLRNLNDGQNNSVAQVKLAAFHMLWYL